MAVWEGEFAVVPRRALAAETSSRASAAHGHRLVERRSPSAGTLTSLPLSRRPDHCRWAELRTWGDEDGICVDVWSENGKATRMIARVDVRRLDARFGAMLLQFACVADAVLVRRDGLVVEPLAAAFGAVFRTSEAWNYASDQPRISCLLLGA